jgi:RNA polymerase sigma factor (sigma-70 family)
LNDNSSSADEVIWMEAETLPVGSQFAHLGEFANMVMALGTVYIVDDDSQVRNAVGDLCEETGFLTQLFASVDEFLAAELVGRPSCLVLDFRFPGASPTGLDLQRMLVESCRSIPIIFISGHSDIRVSVAAMKQGAVEFLPKPFREQELLDALRLGLVRDRSQLELERRTREVRQRFEELSVRERDVLLLIAEGLVAKQIAARLHVSEVTVKVHRTRIMRKLEIRSPIEAVRLVESIKGGFSKASDNWRDASCCRLLLTPEIPDVVHQD